MLLQTTQTELPPQSLAIYIVKNVSQSEEKLPDILKIYPYFEISATFLIVSFQERNQNQAT